MDRGAGQRPVLILGAGINGAAVARELALNGVHVVLVDAKDIAAGASAKSSRLIHGGLRYLEYGEFDLVRESLAERGRLLRLAPQFVRPLRFHIPVRGRLGGLITSARRFLRLGEASNRERGKWLVRMGLWLYDSYARDPSVPRRAVHRASDPDIPHFDGAKYPWVCSYTDAQMLHPERFVLALLRDAIEGAPAAAGSLEVYPWHRARPAGQRVEIVPSEGQGDGVLTLDPAVIINATGAWGDRTLEELGVPSRRLFGGTKGSHILLRGQRYLDLLGAGATGGPAAGAVYAEADDGRLVFILPVRDGIFVGTTDEPFDEPPERAIASSAEQDYLIELVNTVLPEARVTRSDIAMHYCGVRPLPYVDASCPSGVTRRHWIEETRFGNRTVFTLIGGKLTTCRSLGEQVADRVLDRLGRTRAASTRDRTVPGGENYPASDAALEKTRRELAARLGYSPEQVRVVWDYVGSRAEAVLRSVPASDRASLPGTDIPIAFVRYVIENEWARHLEDLVERRLMLIYEPGLSRATLLVLTQLLVESGQVSAAAAEEELRRATERLALHYGLGHLEQQA